MELVKLELVCVDDVEIRLSYDGDKGQETELCRETGRSL